MTKKCWFILVLIIMVFQGAIFSGAEDLSKKAAKLVKKGDEAAQKQNFEKALEAYNQAIEMAPEYARAYAGKGRVLVSQGKADEGIQNLKQAIVLDPNDAETKQFFSQNLFQLAGQAINQQQFDKANDYFLKLIAIPGIDTENQGLFQKALFQLATNYFMMRNNADSLKYYLQLSGLLDPITADKRLLIQTTYQVGANYSALRKYKEAVEYFVKLTDYPELQAPEYHALYLSTLYMVGLNANFTEDFPKAIDALTKFLELAQTSPDHAQFLPLANLLLGSIHMTQLQQEVAKIPEKEKDKTKIAELANNKKQIETYLSKAIELQPNLEPAYMHLGNYYYFCNDTEKTIATYKTLMEKFPNSQDLDQYKKFLSDIEKEKEDQNKKEGQKPK